MKYNNFNNNIQSGLDGVGNLWQVEAVDGAQIAVISQQIKQLTCALAETEERQIAQNNSMCSTVETLNT